MRIRVLFLEDVPPRYRAGEVYEVRAGFARNYLLPKGMAVLATPDQLKRIEKVKRAAEERRRKEAQAMQALAERLEGLTLTITARAAEGGKLYGSITPAIIAQRLSEQLGQEIERRLILLPEPIKTVGTYTVPVRLLADIVPTVTVVVEAEERKGQAPGDKGGQEAG